MSISVVHRPVPMRKSPASAWAGKAWDQTSAPMRQLAADRKNTFCTVPASEMANWRKAAAGVAAEWDKEVAAKGLEGQKLIGEAKALINWRGKQLFPGNIPRGSIRDNQRDCHGI